MPAPRDPHPELPVDPDAAPPHGLHLQWTAAVLAAAGGFVGTLARYGLFRLAPTHSARWPWGTFLANVLGAFVLGLLLESLSARGPDVGRRRAVRLLIGTGFCGAFTTYSALAVESDLLVRDHRPALAIGYLAATVVIGLGTTVLGVLIGARSRRGAPDAAP